MEIQKGSNLTAPIQRKDIINNQLRRGGGGGLFEPLESKDSPIPGPVESCQCNIVRTQSEMIQHCNDVMVN